MHLYSSVRGSISSKAVVREQKQASASRISLLLLVPFACTSRIKQIAPQPWPSPPEPCSHSGCTQGPSTSSTLCRTRGREGDLHVLPKAGSLQPPTSQEFPFVSSPLLSSFIATQGSSSWPRWSSSSSSPVIAASHSSFAWWLSTLSRAHLPQQMKPANMSCSQALDIHILSQELFLWSAKDTPRLQLTLPTTHGT